MWTHVMTANFLRSLRNQADSPISKQAFQGSGNVHRDKWLHFTWKYASEGLLYRVAAAGLLLNPTKPLPMNHSVL